MPNHRKRQIPRPLRTHRPTRIIPRQIIRKPPPVNQQQILNQRPQREPRRRPRRHPQRPPRHHQNHQHKNRRQMHRVHPRQPLAQKLQARPPLPLHLPMHPRQNHPREHKKPIHPQIPSPHHIPHRPQIRGKPRIQIHMINKHPGRKRRPANRQIRYLSAVHAQRLSQQKEARQPRRAAGQVQGGNASHTAE